MSVTGSSDPCIQGGVLDDPPIGGGVEDPALAAGTVERQGPAGPPGKDGRDGAIVVRPERAYAVAVLAGQTVIPISPPPTDLNGFALFVNGVAYGPPDGVSVSAVTVTWLGGFPLDPSDDVRVRYF